MKTIYLLFLLGTLTCFSQNTKSIQVVYMTVLDPIITKKSDNEKLEKINSEINNFLNDKRFVLSANSKGFVFKEENGLELNERQQKISRIANSIYTIYPYSYNLNKKILCKNFNDVSVITNSNLEWSILNESKKIDDYLCYKAECIITFKTRSGSEGSRNVIAWYSPEINFNYGPNGYMGLPGLILELEYNKTKLVVKEIKLFDEEINIEFPNTKEITEKEFLEQLQSQLN